MFLLDFFLSLLTGNLAPQQHLNQREIYTWHGTFNLKLKAVGDVEKQQRQHSAAVSHREPFQHQWNIWCGRYGFPPLINRLFACVHNPLCFSVKAANRFMVKTSQAMKEWRNEGNVISLDGGRQNETWGEGGAKINKCHTYHYYFCLSYIRLSKVSMS